MNHQRRITVKTSPCPGCGAIGTLRRIVWGLPVEAIDLNKYAIGGCCIPENPPELACSECPWSGHRGHLIPNPQTFSP
jgi:hypothetical protein